MADLNNSQNWTEDIILKPLIEKAINDTDTLGLILSGSRAAGCADKTSDYDVYLVVTNLSYQERSKQNKPNHIKQTVAGQPLLDLVYTCPDELSRIAANPSWQTFGFVTAQVLLDKTGEVAALLKAISTPPPGRAEADVAAWFDAYLNAFYRSLKAWQRNNELGGRLLASESVMHLIRALFALEKRWPPYLDRLRNQLNALENQGWQPDLLENMLLNITGTGEPKVQKQLEEQVETLMRQRGYGYVVEGWLGEIERVKALFD